MRTGSRARKLIAALAIALLLPVVFAITSTSAAVAQESSTSGGPRILTCQPRSNENAADPTPKGAPSTGPETAATASNDQAVNPLWCISGVSGGSAPQVDTTGCGSGGGTTADVTIESSTRGFDWVC